MVTPVMLPPGATLVTSHALIDESCREDDRYRRGCTLPLVPQGHWRQSRPPDAGRDRLPSRKPIVLISAKRYSIATLSPLTWRFFQAAPERGQKLRVIAERLVARKPITGFGFAAPMGDSQPVDAIAIAPRVLNARRLIRPPRRRGGQQGQNLLGNCRQPAHPAPYHAS
jgi:hypothetical protein